MRERTVAVLGGGIGGIVAARSLRRRLDGQARVVLIDRSLTFSFAPSYLWVMSGARQPERITADRRHVEKAGLRDTRDDKDVGTLEEQYGRD